jgi:segregation and condensation protein A
LFNIAAKEHIVVTFLAVLELIKRKEIDVEQHENFGDIFVHAVKEGAEGLGNS